MNIEYHIRFNKRHGQPGWGDTDSVWRVIGGGRNLIVKHVQINVPCRGEKTGHDWSMVCDGELTIDTETSTATIN